MEKSISGILLNRSRDFVCVWRLWFPPPRSKDVVAFFVRHNNFHVHVFLQRLAYCEAIQTECNALRTKHMEDQSKRLRQQRWSNTRFEADEDEN